MTLTLKSAAALTVLVAIQVQCGMACVVDICPKPVMPPCHGSSETEEPDSNNNQDCERPVLADSLDLRQSMAKAAAAIVPDSAMVPQSGTESRLDMSRAGDRAGSFPPIARVLRI